ncbi:hypothetical protein BJX76DRAFT_362399 [Aspergillus varians]
MIDKGTGAMFRALPFPHATSRLINEVAMEEMEVTLRRTNNDALDSMEALFSKFKEALSGDDYREIMAILLEASADTNLADGRGWQAIHAASNEPHIIRMLLNKGADVDSTSKLGYTPLVMALLRKNEKSVKVLLSHSPGPDLTAGHPCLGH